MTGRASGRSTTTYSYDANGQRLTENKPAEVLGSLTTLTTNFHYDKNGAVTQTIHPDTTSIKSVFDSLGKQIATTDQKNRDTDFRYDEMGRMDKTTYPDGTFEQVLLFDKEGRRKIWQAYGTNIHAQLLE